MAHEKLPAGSTKLIQAVHAFERAAHAVSLRHANLEHAAQLEQVGGDGTEAAESKVRIVLALCRSLLHLAPTHPPSLPPIPLCVCACAMLILSRADVHVAL